MKLRRMAVASVLIMSIMSCSTLMGACDKKDPVETKEETTTTEEETEETTEETSEETTTESTEETTEATEQLVGEDSAFAETDIEDFSKIETPEIIAYMEEHGHDPNLMFVPVVGNNITPEERKDKGLQEALIVCDRTTFGSITFAKFDTVEHAKAFAEEAASVGMTLEFTDNGDGSYSFTSTGGGAEVADSYGRVTADGLMISATEDMEI